LTNETPASIAENIEKIIRLEEDAIRRRSPVEVLTDAIGSFIGTLPFVVLQIVAFVGWVVMNTGAIPGIAVFDPFPAVVDHFIGSGAANRLRANEAEPDERDGGSP
jgi:uncharacterized membrane protein